MKEGWETRLLGDVCALVNRGVAPKYVETGGVAVLNQKCVRDHRIALDLGRRHDAAAKKVDPDRFIRLGDVLVNSTGNGTLGRVAQVRSDPPEPTTVDTHVTIVRPEVGRFYPDFFGYMLIQIEDEIARSGEGASGQTELARSTLQNKFSVSFPTSLPEQQRIVAILDEAFAGLATATANAEKNLENARELFKSYLNTAFGQNGEGWVRQTLEDIVEVKGGKRVPKGYKLLTEPTKHPYISVSDFNDEGGIDQTNLRYISDEVHQGISRYVISDRDVYVSIAGTIGKTGIIPPELDGANLTENACRLVLKSSVSNKFLYYFTKTNSFAEQALANTRIAAQPKLALVRLKTVNLYVPTLVEQEKLVCKLDDLVVEQKRLDAIYHRKISEFAELKQSILQKAFSGELTSPPSQAIKEAAE